MNIEELKQKVIDAHKAYNDFMDSKTVSKTVEELEPGKWKNEFEYEGPAINITRQVMLTIEEQAERQKLLDALNQAQEEYFKAINNGTENSHTNN